jgi:hypothetical protein
VKVELARRLLEQIARVGLLHRRVGIVPAFRPPLEGIAAEADLPVDVAGDAADAADVLKKIVVRL